MSFRMGDLAHYNYNFALMPIPMLTRMTFMTIPSIVTMYAAMMYYSDFLQAQSMHFYDPFHHEVFDFIVIGGGSSGAVVANRLSKNSKVLLLEGGGDPSPLTSIPAMAVYLQRIDSTDWQYKTVPQNNSCLSMIDRRSMWPRGRGLGGTSNLNFMIYQRGNPKDYDSLAEATGDKEWRYDNLLPFFKKSENYHGNYENDKYHGKAGPLYIGKVKSNYLSDYFVNAAKELGYPEIDPNSEQTQGFSHLDATMKDGIRWGTYDAFIRPILHRKNLVIYRYARAIKIHLDRRKNAYGVTYVRHGMQKFVRARKEIIVSAGAVDSPKLLMLSGIGIKSHLHDVGISCRVNLPVGQNLQDHVTTLVGPVTMKAKSLLVDRDVNIESFNDYTKKGAGPFSSLAGVSALGFISTPLSNKDWPDIGYFMSDSGVHKTLADEFTYILGLKPGVLHKYYGPHLGKDANFILVMLGKTKSIGEIKLASRSPWDKPIIDPKYYSHPDDIKAMKEAVKFIVNLYEKTATYKKVNAQLAQNPFPGCEHLKMRSDEYYECYIRHLTLTLYHPSSTVPMGRRFNDSTAVVDSQLRVLKTRGLRVMDTSVLRVITNANLNSPAIMIGEKGSHLIRRHWAMQYQVCDQAAYFLLNQHDSMCFYTQMP